MHDLNQISKLNAQAFGDAVENFRRQGRYVIATFTGAHLAQIETFTDEGDALRTFANLVAETPDVHFELLTPTRTTT